MFHYVMIAAIVAGGFLLASLLAIWAFGRFARRARAAADHALPVGNGDGPIDLFAAPKTAANPGASGISLISENSEAFIARAMLARSARRSLDLIYYNWEEDLTGRLLMAEVLAAADRGVRVRMLLDDIGVSIRDEAYKALNAHPGIEIRLFNPTRARKGSLMRGVEMALRALSMTRRMHNKAWIADGRIAIIGGRNIGDAYFGASGHSNFHDLDLFMLGPVVDETTAMFDLYWNSPAVLPLRALAGEMRDRPKLAAFRAGLEQLADSEDARPWRAHLLAEAGRLLPEHQPLHWCQSAHLLADPPEKALGPKRGGQGQNWMMEQLRSQIVQARDHVAITSPYFVPGREGTGELVALAARGVRVEVLTNSLGATDVAAVHGGYAPWRRDLLRGNVTLYELRLTSLRPRLSLRGKSNASLHTKAFLIDGCRGFVGSMNFDPRSASLNTEMGVLFEAPELIARMEQIFAGETDPQTSYRPQLDENGRLVWHRGDGPPLRREPDASLMRRLVARVVAWLPITSQL